MLKSSVSIDCQSVKSKHDDILEPMHETLPASPEEAKEIGKDYPHEKNIITMQTYFIYKAKT